MDEFLRKIYEAGVVGAGGAGFPTHIKLNTKAEYFILNGAECEPLIHSDKYLMRTKAKEIIETAFIIGEHLNAKNIVIGIKEKYHEEIKSLKKAIEETKYENIKLHYFSSFYPAGDEQVLIYEITSRVVPSGGLPKDVNAVVCNIATVYNIYKSIKNESVTRKIISVMGEVKKPIILDTPIGTPVLECLKQAEVDLNKKYSVINGGPMMGRIFESSDIEKEYISKTTNSLIVIPENHYLLKRQNINYNKMIKEALSACIQCRICTDLCPRFILGNALHPHRMMRAIGYGNIENNKVFEESLICCECGVCDYVCPMHLSPRKVNQALKKALTPKGIKYKPELRNVNDNREYRKLPTDRLMYMTDIAKYANQKPEETIVLNPKSVTLMLKQHLGKAAKAIVCEKDNVNVGDLIASVSETEVGANIHSSITGHIIEVKEDRITVQAD